ncbi:MAG: FAD:protein FMN transferase [Firmicutes bacterium]|jgi:thiamine biosynthesis lipoprotein|nr:FAD:protein FMN transferase [Bacillota bacterium]
MGSAHDLEVVTEEAMGTVFSFHIIPGKIAIRDITHALDEAKKTLHLHDEIFSTYKPESPISQIQKGTFYSRDVSKSTTDDIEEVITLCRKAKDLTKGWFDPWHGPVGFDPTGLVKGWSIQKVARLIFSYGPDAVSVNGGGDVYCLAGDPEYKWRFAVAHPWKKDAVAGIVETGHAVATSGTYERGNHFFDPLGYVGTPIISSTVTGPDLAMADAFATALAVGGLEAAKALDELPEYGYYLIDKDGNETFGKSIVFATDDP